MRTTSEIKTVPLLERFLSGDDLSESQLILLSYICGSWVIELWMEEKEFLSPTDPQMKI